MTTQEANKVIDRLTDLSVRISELANETGERLAKEEQMMDTMIRVLQKSVTTTMITRNDLNKEMEAHRNDVTYYRGRIDEMIKSKNTVQAQNDKLVDYQLRIDQHLESALRHGDTKNTTTLKIGDIEK